MFSVEKSDALVADFDIMGIGQGHNHTAETQISVFAPTYKLSS